MEDTKGVPFWGNQERTQPSGKSGLSRFCGAAQTRPRPQTDTGAQEHLVEPVPQRVFEQEYFGEHL